MEKQQNPSKNAVTLVYKNVQKNHSNYIKEINKEDTASAVGNCC